MKFRGLLERTYLPADPLSPEIRNSMPAPPTALVNALRRGTVARHVFFEMTHSQGTVRMWDGVGDFKPKSRAFRTAAMISAKVGCCQVAPSEDTT